MCLTRIRSYSIFITIIYYFLILLSPLMTLIIFYNFFSAYIPYAYLLFVFYYPLKTLTFFISLPFLNIQSSTISYSFSITELKYLNNYLYIYINNWVFSFSILNSKFLGSVLLILYYFLSNIFAILFYYFNCKYKIVRYLSKTYRTYVLLLVKMVMHMVTRSIWILFYRCYFYIIYFI